MRRPMKDAKEGDTSKPNEDIGEALKPFFLCEALAALESRQPKP